jgi:hypothetical protein
MTTTDISFDYQTFETYYTTPSMVETNDDIGLFLRQKLENLVMAGGCRGAGVDAVRSFILVTKWLYNFHEYCAVFMKENV